MTDKNCAVCRQATAGQAVYRGACGHVVRWACLRSAVKRHCNQCPVCGHAPFVTQV